MEATGLAVDLFGGGSIAGRNISTGIWGGGSSSFGQASYSQMPSAGTGSINMRGVDNQRNWDATHHEYEGLGGYYPPQELASKNQAEDNQFDHSWPVGVSVQFELAIPRSWLQNRYRPYIGETGIGIEWGAVFDGKSLNFFETTKFSRNDSYALSGDVGVFYAIPSPYLKEDFTNAHILGDGESIGWNYGYFGWTAAGPFMDGLVSGGNYHMNRYGIGLGMDIGKSNWQTHTTFFGH